MQSEKAGYKLYSECVHNHFFFFFPTRHLKKEKKKRLERSTANLKTGAILGGITFSLLFFIIYRMSKFSTRILCYFSEKKILQKMNT